MLSAAAAHARPSFELADSAARAGDVVHFSISGVDVSATYEVAVDDQQVLEDVSGSPVSGTFTVPDLGDAFRTVSVEAEIRGPDKRKKIKRKLEYLGSALPVTGPPAPAIPPPAPPPSAPPPSAPPVVALGAPSPEPIYPPDAIEETPPAPAATPRSSHEPRQRRGRRSVEGPRNVARGRERRRHAHRGHDRRNRHTATRNTRSKRLAPRTAPFFDSIPKSGASARPSDGGSTLSTKAPRTAVLAATGTRLGDDGGAHAAVVVPALLGLAGLALAGTAVLRRRRLASRPERD